MKQLKAIHDLFRFENNLFRNEAEIFWNEACIGIGQNRAMTTIVLHKEGKADYLFLGSYRPIALENTLSKILEKVIVDCITDIAEEHTLLP